jgi:membrane protein DedA with SNARE-associated domain
MLEDILNSLANFPPFWIYISLFFFSFIENIFPPSPSDVVIIVAGTLVSTNVISFVPTLLVTSIGSVMGFMTLFFIGTQVDKRILEKGRFKFLSTQALEKAEKWFAKYGYWVILGNRFLSGTRAVISFFAGLSELNFKKTFLYALASSTVWNLLIISLGVLFGNNIPLVDSYLKTYSNIVLIVTGVIIAIFIVRYIFQKQRRPKA